MTDPWSPGVRWQEQRCTVQLKNTEQFWVPVGVPYILRPPHNMQVLQKGSQFGELPYYPKPSCVRQPHEPGKVPKAVQPHAPIFKHKPPSLKALLYSLPTLNETVLSSLTNLLLNRPRIPSVQGAFNPESTLNTKPKPPDGNSCEPLNPKP